MLSASSVRRSFNCGFNFKAGTPAPFLDFLKLSQRLYFHMLKDTKTKKASTPAFFKKVGFFKAITAAPFSHVKGYKNKQGQHSGLEQRLRFAYEFRCLIADRSYVRVLTSLTLIM